MSEEEMREIDESDRGVWYTGEQRGNDRRPMTDGGHRRRNRRGVRVAKSFYVIYDTRYDVLNNERPNVGGVSITVGVGTVLRLDREAWSIV